MSYIIELNNEHKDANFASGKVMVNLPLLKFSLL